MIDELRKEIKPTLYQRLTGILFRTFLVKWLEFKIWRITTKHRIKDELPLTLEQSLALVGVCAG